MNPCLEPTLEPGRAPWYALARMLRQSDSGPRWTCPLSGIRFYGVPSPTEECQIALPGVTSVLSSSDTPEDKERLENWRKREIAEGRDPDLGRKRGSRIHAMLEHFIMGETPEAEVEEDLPFYKGMSSKLTPYSEFLWSERPLRRGWEHTWSAPEGTKDRLARVWSTTWGFAGTPDVIGRLKDGRTVLGDFKTSNQPYYRPNGSKVPRHRGTSYKKYKKTVRQLCAYRLAIQETLGLEIDTLHIIVGLSNSDDAQSFFVDQSEMEYETENFKRLCVQFWEAQQKRMNQLVAA